MLRNVKCLETESVPDEFDELITEILVDADDDTTHTYVGSCDPDDEEYGGEELRIKFDQWLVEQGASPGERIIVERGSWQ